jgi:amino acid permease
MTKHRSLILPAVVLGVVLLVVAVIYLVDSASALPSFFPGHQAGSSHHHVKHGIAAFVVALACFAFAWFQTGPAQPGTTAGAGARGT